MARVTSKDIFEGLKGIKEKLDEVSGADPIPLQSPYRLVAGSTPIPIPSPWVVVCDAPIPIPSPWVVACDIPIPIPSPWVVAGIDPIPFPNTTRLLDKKDLKKIRAKQLQNAITALEKQIEVLKLELDLLESKS